MDRTQLPHPSSSYEIPDNLVRPQRQQCSAKKTFRTLEEIGVEFARSDSCSDGINIVFTPMGAPVEDSNHLIIYCPGAEVSSPEDAVRSMNESSESGKDSMIPSPSTL